MAKRIDDCEMKPEKMKMNEQESQFVSYDKRDAGYQQVLQERDGA
jgi:hypothetical protein